MPLSQVLMLDETGRIDSGFFSKAQIKVRSLAANWEELGSHCSTVACGPFGSTILDTNYVESGIPMIRPFNLREMRSDAGEIAFLEDAFIRSQSLKLFHRGDLMFARVGDVGCSVLVQEQATISPNVIAASLSVGNINPFFAAIFFNTPFGRLQMEGAMKVVAQPTISTELIRKLRIPLFSADFQSKIELLYLQIDKLILDSRDNETSAEQTLLQSLGLENWQPPEPLTYTRRVSEVFSAGRLDSEFHRPKCDSLRQVLQKKFQIKQLAELGIVENGQTVPYADDGKVPIIRSGDLSGIDDDSKFLRANESESIFKLEQGDILISSIGFGSIGKVQVFDKPGTYGAVSEVTVIRQNQLNPYFVASFLRSVYGQMQIERYITGATGQLHLYKRDVRKFFVPVIPASEQLKFEKFAKKAHTARREAQELLEKAKHAVEIAIEEGEAAGLAFLQKSPPNAPRDRE